MYFQADYLPLLLFTPDETIQVLAGAMISS